MVFILIYCMTFYWKKTSFLPLLLVLWLCIPFVTLAETKDTTDIIIENNDIDIVEYQEEIKEIQWEEENPIGKKPLPVVPEDIKAKRVALEIQKETETTVDVKFDIPNVDTQRVQQAWLEMINSVRSEKAGDYILDNNLIKTSTERANHLGKARKFKKMHQRPGQSCKNYRCYDLWEWFTDRGVSPSAWESIWYGWYSCKKDDCTDALIEATKKTFRFFMSEAKRNWPHYQMVVSWKYSKVWIWISQTRASRWNAYVLVMHVSN